MYFNLYFITTFVKKRNTFRVRYGKQTYITLSIYRYEKNKEYKGFLLHNFDF